MVTETQENYQNRNKM